MRKLIIILCLLILSGCASPKQNFYKRKYPTENNKSYKSKRGLMLLENTQLGRNKYYNSKSYAKTKKQVYKKYKRNRK